MADNTTFQSDTIASPPAALVVAGDDIGGVLYQRVKLVLGADGAADNDVDAGQQLSAASVPVVLSSNHNDIKITLDGEAVTISGTVQVQSNSANIATEATAAAIQTAVELIDNAIAGNEMQVDIVGGGPVGATTDAEAAGDGSVIAILKRLRTLLGGTLTVSGTVTANLSAVDNAVLDSIDTAVNGTLTVDGSGVTQPISGTVTANLSAVDNAVLDAIAAAQLPDGHNVTVDNASLAITAAALPLPSGAATAANQLPDGHNVTVDNAGNAPVPVQITDGTNPATIRNLAANDALNVAIVDGDGNQVTTFGGSGGTSATDDGDFTAGSTSGTPVMGAYESSPTAVTDGDMGIIAIDANRNVKVSIEADSVGIGGGTQYTEGDTDATITGTAVLMEGAGNELVVLQGTAADGVLVNLGSNNDVTVSGVSTAANQATVIGHLDGVEGLLTTIDADTGNIDTSLNAIEAGFAAEGAALGSGVLLQGDDGTDRKNINVDATTGDVQVDVTNTVTVDGSGVTQPVSGTVTANLSATDNAVLDAIQAAVEIIDNAISGNEMQVDVVSSALPSGAATSANQSTIIGHVDGIETVLGTIDADTSALAGAVSGSEMQVDIVGALPAGTATIGAVNVKPATSGGLTIFRSIDVDETEEEVKATAGQVYGWYMYNAAATVRYVKFYNATAANVAVGTTTPVLTVPLPATAGANVEFTNGIAFGTAITIAATTGVADNDTGAPSANDVIANIFYA